MHVYYLQSSLPSILHFKWPLTLYLLKIGHVYEIIYYTDQESYLLQLCSQVMNHPMYVYGQYKEMAVTHVTFHSPHTSVMVHVVLLFI